jgi:hypothetical protein
MKEEKVERDSKVLHTQEEGRVGASSIVYGSTKGFVSYGGFTHVGFPSRTLSV